MQFKSNIDQLNDNIGNRTNQLINDLEQDVFEIGKGPMLDLKMTT